MLFIPNRNTRTPDPANPNPNQNPNPRWPGGSIQEPSELEIEKNMIKTNGCPQRLGFWACLHIYANGFLEFLEKVVSKALST
jgi:hypothetical protein